MPIATRSGFERPTMQELLDRVTADLNARISGMESTIARAALTPLMLFTPIFAAVICGVCYGLYEYLDYGLNQFFVQSATGARLDKWGELFRISRKTATRAILRATFGGDEGAAIEAGRILVSDAGVQYEALELAVAQSDGSGGYAAIVQARAVVGGASGNLALGSTLSLASPIVGLDSDGAITGVDAVGYDTESDDDLRERILFRIDEPPCMGAPIDYKRWATEAANVKRAFVIRAYPRPGYVTVLYTTTTGGPIPDGGAAYELPIESLNEDDGAYYLLIRKSELASALGRDAEAGWWADGYALYNISERDGEPYVRVDSTGLVDSGLFWRIGLSGDVGTLADYNGIHLLDIQSKLVRDHIYHRDDDGEWDRMPAHAHCYVGLPVPLPIATTASIPQDDTSLQNAISSEVEAAINAAASTRKTITAWELHQAMAQAPGHTNHRILDINELGPMADITTARGELHTFGGLTWEAWS